MTEEKALLRLQENFDVRTDGMIVPKKSQYQPTPRELEAIMYLFDEYDYGYMPRS